MFESLTKYIRSLECNGSRGEWIIDRERSGTAEDPKQMPFVAYDALAIAIGEAIYDFVDAHDEMQLTRYGEILEENGISWSLEPMTEADVSHFDGRTVMAFLVGAVRAERFCDGALLSFFKNGCILRWLRRLEEIDGNTRDLALSDVEGGANVRRIHFHQ